MNKSQSQQLPATEKEKFDLIVFLVGALLLSGDIGFDAGNCDPSLLKKMILVTGVISVAIIIRVGLIFTKSLSIRLKELNDYFARFLSLKNLGYAVLFFLLFSVSYALQDVAQQSYEKDIYSIATLLLGFAFFVVVVIRIGSEMVGQYAQETLNQKQLGWSEQIAISLLVAAVSFGMFKAGEKFPFKPDKQICYFTKQPAEDKK